MKQLERRLDEYFDGFWQYGLKEAKDIEAVPVSDRPWLRIDADDDLYIGPHPDVRKYYVACHDVKRAELERHHQVNGQWKPGRLVVESRPGTYQVWVRYDQALNARSRKRVLASLGTSTDATPDPWGRLPARGARILHYDRRSEAVPQMESQMDVVSAKLARYFGAYETGIYREAQNATDKGAVWSVKPGAKTTGYLKAMNARGRHIFIRPTFEKEPCFMMCDDLDRQGLDTHHKVDGHWKPGRLVVESSPGNYQVWIRSDRPLSVEEKTYWLQKMNSDPGASPRHRWGRCPGFRNRKPKYETAQGYPLARLVWVDWKNRARIPQVEIGPPRDKSGRQAAARVPRPFRRSLGPSHLPTRANYEKGDESATDFAYALALLRRGVDRAEVAQKIRTERTNWANHSGEPRMQAYLKRTLDRAETVINDGRYEITVKDVQRKRERKFHVGGFTGDKEALKDKARAAVAQMGYTDTQNLDVSIRRVNAKSMNDRQLEAGRAVVGSGRGPGGRG